ncbi:hypothetical protein [Vibrio sp. VB16]|uniref:hypothetical protein n=1 Tax=Vibrio sp. VB16 TaxID=2785746 RepID=UPI0018A080E3|nr:hypothetical protein [Vibrio sp. VB16]UGA55718.1 hypothetical protein IUZ65_005010 [Vibrio sp. VB16]
MAITYELVRDAIINKKQVFATYQGHEKEMCPHVIGKKNGRQQVLCYQFGGTDSKGIVTGDWKCIQIALLANVRTVNGQWHTDNTRSRPQNCVDLIDVEVSL